MVCGKKKKNGEIPIEFAVHAFRRHRSRHVREIERIDQDRNEPRHENLRRFRVGRITSNDRGDEAALRWRFAHIRDREKLDVMLPLMAASVVGWVFEYYRGAFAH